MHSLLATSLGFVALAIAIPWRTQPLLKGLVALLAVTSCLYHATYHPATWILDRIACRVVVVASVVYAVAFRRRLALPPACYAACLAGVGCVHLVPCFRRDDTRRLHVGAHVGMHAFAAAGLACLWFRDAAAPA